MKPAVMMKEAEVAEQDTFSNTFLLILRLSRAEEVGKWLLVV